MKHLIVLAAAAGLVALSACNKMQSSAKPKLSSDDDKTVYAIGVDMGNKLKQLQLSKNELSILKMGIDDGSGSGKPQVEPREFLPKVSELIRNRQKLFAEKEGKEAEKFMAKAASMTNAKKTESGLVMVETQAGTGEQPKETDRVRVNYHGTLRSGEGQAQADRTRVRGSLPVGRIRPWRVWVCRICWACFPGGE
ncbi:MAG: FKBP-type peptidyl-prolyl cis-trans isomerase N-terminal domain-containing protein, partial [Pseudomonadota bacterium]